jgi:hypothetical protein
MSPNIQPTLRKRRQFAPSAPKAKKAKPLVRPISQIQLQLKQVNSDKDLFLQTVHHVLRWINLRVGQKLPKEAWEGKPFTVNQIGAQPTGVVVLDEPRYWTARFNDADKEVPMRTWTTEIGVGQGDDGNVLFAARLICTTHGEDLPFHRTVPSFMRGVLRGQSAILDDRPMETGPVEVTNEAGVDSLISLLENPGRRCPVIVISLAEGCEDFSKGMVNANLVYLRTLGAAHVFVISSSASFVLTTKIGKEFSVYRGAVRLYRPRFNHLSDDSFSHPLTLLNRILLYKSEPTNASYEELLGSQALAVTAFSQNLEDALPTFDRVRQMIATQQRRSAQEAGSSDAELLDLADKEIARLEAELSQQKDTYDGLLLSIESELEVAVATKDEFQARGHSLRGRIASLELSLSEAAIATPIPSDLGELENWANKHLEGPVVLHSRALRGAKKSDYENPRLVFEALLLLRNYYVPMRIDASPERASLNISRKRVGDPAHRDVVIGI